MDLTQESFNRLLTWLHPNREEAARTYERIRLELIKKFQSHGCSVPDKLADDTIDRVAGKLEELVETYVGEREPYFRRTGYYILLEYYAKKTEGVELTEDLTSPAAAEDIEPEFACLDKCMKDLPPRKRDLIEKYYQGDKAIKIRLRKELALSLNLELPALRVHARRIRAILKDCIIECMHA